ncbi:hypothetical protein C8R47DRAFT_1110113 [Mycena vitilis]|nr:hypothetical protein C8R47DRAFT_1110113 [Mycena vitilis]
MPRLTRAAAARQIQEQATGMPAPTVATSSTNERKRRRTSPVAAPAPQRASARQQKQRTMVPDGVPPAVIAATTTPPTKRARARSASRESNETLVASSSTSSFSRAASVSSAATIVVEVVNDTSKGKGKARLIVPAPGDDGGVAPMETESVAGTGMVTRSRTKKVPDVKPARAAPYPTAKDAQLAAGRSKSRAPTGKRKVAKSKAT